MFTAPAGAATITVTITGTTGEIRVGEGPIFEHRSYTLIPPGDPFSLTYTFDEEKGKQTISELSNGLISQSEIENTKLSSPGTSATLQIGRAVWEFGSSIRSQVVMKTSATSKSEQFVYVAQAGGNRVSAQIAPGKGGYWPKNGDWRASFTSGPLDGSTASFAADNDRVSASGSLTPLTIAVAGVDIDGQWLRYATNPGGEGKWQLAHTSPRGGYIVERVTRTILGTRADGSPITPSSVEYWQAWQVPAGADAPANASDSVSNEALAGSTGDESVSAVARFYEGLILPPAFGAGKSPYAAERLSSTIDPDLSTGSATLPVVTSSTQKF
ncbi:MAG: hypothetical protein QOH35_2109 [Acidobacteriaceae bacterium]|nr:hypothetical protein [Acidobacteriaceae bacterium]